MLSDSVFRRVEADTRGVLTLTFPQLILQTRNLRLVCSAFSPLLVGRAVPRGLMLPDQ